MNDGFTAIESMYEDYIDNYNFLLGQGMISFATEYKSQFSKIMVLSAASFFEARVVEEIKTNLNPSNCELTKEFISRKALTRQYHTLFNWDSSNANQFFSLMGDGFKSYMATKVRESDELSLAISDFISIGRLRNKLAHENYALFQVSDTAEEIYNKFINANNNFINRLPALIVEYREGQQTIT
ncbi:HEPN domain-containing protein [Aeromonas sp. 600886]|uniref:HEPN domain-containing protein n=1 Tax=Aeromonas sp. 600886 TaxID=2712033 RepID=UPI003BA0EB2F